MIATRAYAALDARAPLRPFAFERRDPRDHDVVIDILYCGVCHSDLHQARNEWSSSVYPMVPGHEIVGKVASVGKAVTKVKAGDVAGVGCMVDSCHECDACKRDLEPYCEKGCNWTYNGVERDGRTPTQGGYSDRIVVDERFVLTIAAGQPLDMVAPLLCAGITLYSPLVHWGAGKGRRIGIVGLGGLGHMGVKLAAAMGAEVTVLSSSPSKKADALRFGAHDFVLTSDEAPLEKHRRRFDLIIDTASAHHSLATYLRLLRTDGAMVLVGVPERPAELKAADLIGNRLSIAGSLIGGIAETQRMLDFCAARGITSDIEVIPIQEIERAYERMLRGDIRYRFVIDMESLAR
jgi:alcohol dehydrogenase (NADP+)